MKLVRESIQFKRDENPYKSVGVGTYELIELWLNKYNIHEYTINDDYSIDVNNMVNLSMKNLNNLPDYIQFNKVDGAFYIDNNNLTTLKGCPKDIRFSFYVDHNNLTSLEYCPEIIKDTFNFAFNNISSLDYLPKEVWGDLYTYRNARKFTRYEIKKRCNVKKSINL